MVRLLPIAAAAAAVIFVRREWRRINSELDRVRARSGRPVGTLRRDRVTGEWRPSR